MSNINKKRVLIFVVAYNAEKTIEWVISRIPLDLCGIYDLEVLIIDDSSKDNTFQRGSEVSQSDKYPFKIRVLYNPVNQGYGGNQKIGYHYAIENKFDFVVLMHGDGQYPPEFIPELLKPLVSSQAEAVFGSRMINPKDALKGGMPVYKFFGNKILTTVQNFVLGSKLSEFHSGFRIYSVEALRKIPFERNSNDFDFDTEIIIQFTLAKLVIAELPIPTHYGDEVCHVNGMKYALDILKDSLQARAQKISLFYDVRFDCEPEELGGRDALKLNFDSAYSRVFDEVPSGSNVLDLGSGSGVVGAALKKKKNCNVTGIDIEKKYINFEYGEQIIADLNKGLPELSKNKFDYILLIDVIEHLSDPITFLDDLRKLAARDRAVVIISTANVAFILMRSLLFLGRFEYGKRGILDLTHTRLYTVKTLCRLLSSTGFEVLSVGGTSVPAPFIFGNNIFSGFLLSLNRFLANLMPSLFGFQLYVKAKALPTLETLLSDAHVAAEYKEKFPAETRV
jgi:glycosyltransferase involved in cell wall biosynthesis/SAM-dependent methyltransferase